MIQIGITGSTGFIGTNLCNILSDYNIIPIKNNTIIENIDIVCHLAANPLVKEDGLNLIQSNINLTADILEKIKNSKRKTHFIFISSATVYGNTIDMATEDAKLNPNSIYAATKISSEYLIKAYSNLGYIDYTILRSVANVGRYCTHGVVKDIIQKLQNTTSDYIDVLGNSPGSYKPYIYVVDTARAIKHCIDYKIYGTYNISTCQSIYIKDLISIIQNEIGTNKRCKWSGIKGGWAGDDKYVNISNQAILNTGFKFLGPDTQSAIRLGVKQICQK